MKSLTKNQIISKIAEEAEISKSQARAAIDAIADLSIRYAAADDGFTIPNFCKVQIKTQRERTMQDPRTREVLEIPAKRKLRFTLKKVAKQAILTRDQELGLSI